MTKVDGAELCTCLAVLVLVLPALSAAQERDTTKPDSLKAVPPRIQTAPGLNTPSRLPLASGEYRKSAPRFEVLLQMRGDYIGGEPGVATFFFRKVELGIKGQVAEHVAFSVELDPVRPDDPFRRTYIRLSYSEHLLLKLGLEKAPVGLAELTSSDVIPFVSRPEISDRFAPAEELGIHLETPWKHWLLQFSVTNGNGREPRDDNKRKDVSARVVWGPLSWLSLGASAIQGASGEVPHDRDRYNVELKLGDDLTGAQAEGYRALDDPVWSTASYIEAYRAIPVGLNWLTHVQPAVRYEWIDRSDDAIAEELSALTIGLNLLFHGHAAKLQLNYLAELRSRRRAEEWRAQYQLVF